jgi:Mor family transcriptional regulator
VDPVVFDLSKELTLEDLPSDELKWVVESIGLTLGIKLMKDLRGIRIDFPKNPFKRAAHRYIRENYDGTNAKVLARQFNLSEGHIYALCNKKEKS